MHDPGIPYLIGLSSEWKEPFSAMARDWQRIGDNRYQLGLDRFDAYLEHLEMLTDP